MRLDVHVHCDTPEEAARVTAAVAASGRLSWEQRGVLLAAGWRAPNEQPDGAAPDREALGREVRRVWVDWAREQAHPKPSWLAPWEDLSEPDREVDRRIGERLYIMGAIAGAPGERAWIDDLVRERDAASAEAEALRKRVAELETEIRAAREELGTIAFEPLVVAARRVAEALTQELGGEERRRALAEAREQGAAEMRERAAALVDGWVTPDVLMHDSHTAHAYHVLADKIRALPLTAEPAPWTLTAEAASALLRGGWRQAGELWREPWGGFVDPRTPFGQETLRRALERLRAKAEPTVDRVVLDGPAAARAEAAALVGLDAGGGP